MMRTGRGRLSSRIVGVYDIGALGRQTQRAAFSQSASTSKEVSTPAEEVRKLLEGIDRPSYLASGFFPAPLRAHFLAIRAFNAEVARVADSVDNELMARIRIAWWKDAIRSAFQGRPPKNPTMIAIADAIHDPIVQKHGGLVEHHFVSICDARESDLTAPVAPPTLEEVELYAERTSSRLFYLSLNLIGISSPAVDEAFSHLGKARGIAHMLASMPFHAGVVQSNTPSQVTVEGEGPARRPKGLPRPRQRRIVLPQEYLSAHNVIEEEVYRRGAEASGLKDAVFDTATRANDYIISARSILRNEFPNKIPAYLTGPMVETTTAITFLEALERADFDIFDTKLQLLASGRGWRLPWAMFKAGWFGPRH
jgi:NADH dehydrogenase [ubiquinone] 1 alpha subcomplex assembly factor 6